MKDVQRPLSTATSSTGRTQFDDASPLALSSVGSTQDQPVWLHLQPRTPVQPMEVVASEEDRITRASRDVIVFCNRRACVPSSGYACRGSKTSLRDVGMKADKIVQVSRHVAMVEDGMIMMLPLAKLENVILCLSLKTLSYPVASEFDLSSVTADSSSPMNFEQLNPNTKRSSNMWYGIHVFSETPIDAKCA